MQLSTQCPTSQSEWESLPLNAQLLFKVECMQDKAKGLNDRKLHEELEQVRQRLVDSDSVTREIAVEYSTIADKFKRRNQLEPQSPGTPRTSGSAVINSKGKKLNKRQVAVKKAYDMVKKGEVEFEGSDQRFISLGNKHFAELINKLQASS